MKVEVLGFAGCPNFAPAIQYTRAALRQTGVEAHIGAIHVENAYAAHEASFLGSPTVRINGLDVEPAARTLRDFGLGCRTYVANGKRQGFPPQEWIEVAIREALHNEGV